MPTISHFYGIIIVMYLRNKEHNPRMCMPLHKTLMPHFQFQPVN